MPQLEVTAEYRESFVKADQTFLYQLVFDPIKRRVVPLTPYANDIDPSDLPFAGVYLDESTAYQLALGNLDVQNLDRLDNYDPDRIQLRSSSSIWSASFSVRTRTSSPSTTVNVQMEVADQKKSFLTRQTSARVNFSLIPSQSSVSSLIADQQLTDQYMRNEECAAAPSSPILGHRKRKRLDNDGATEGAIAHSIWSAATTSAELPPSDFNNSLHSSAESVASDKGETMKNVHEIHTPKRCNPFIKVKKSPGESLASPPPAENQFSALNSFSQLRKRHIDGEEVITSCYFSQTHTSSSSSNSNDVGACESKELISQVTSPTRRISIAEKIKKTLLVCDNWPDSIANAPAVSQSLQSRCWSCSYL